jgi:hypothetical protein
MTSLENPTVMTLANAVSLTGPGGKVAHSLAHVEYFVVEDNSRYFLMRVDGTGELRSIEDFSDQESWYIPDPELGSVGTFFSTLSVGDIIRRDGSSIEYIWLGDCYDLDDQPVKRAFDINWLTNVDWSNDDLLQPNRDRWIKTDRTADRLTLNLISQIEAQRGSIKNKVETIREQSREIAEMVKDFTVINDLLCEYAVEKGYCPDFEETISEWNEKTTRLKLLGRQRQWSVTVEIGGVTGVLSVGKFRTEDEAINYVENMDKLDILKELIDQGHDFWDMYLEVSEAEPE